MKVIEFLKGYLSYIPAWCLDWKGWDKLVHFLVCLMIACVNPKYAIGAALGKEYGDYKANGNHWCWWDLIWDTLGILCGTAIHIWSGCPL